MQRHFGQHGACGEAEHAGVPPVVTAGHIGLGGFQVGFFDEALDLIPLGFDIAKAGVRAFRVDAKRDNAPLQSQHLRLSHSDCKSGLIGNQMVSGQHQQRSVVSMGTLHLQGRCRDCCGSVSTKRLEHEAGEHALGVDWAVFVFGLEKQLTVGHRQDFLHPGQRGTP